MKILTISDRVDELLYSPKIVDRFDDIDLVLSSGDLPSYYLEYIVTMLNVPLYYVFGNHGPVRASPADPLPVPAGCVNIDNRVVRHRGLLLAGLEGSMRYRPGDYQYTDTEMWAKIVRLMPRLLWNRLRHGRYVDILITHAPPRGIHDDTDLCHTGFRGFLWFMQRFSPRFLIHGHVHLYFPNQPSRTFYGRTEIINTYGYQVLETEVPPRPPVEAPAAPTEHR